MVHLVVNRSAATSTCSGPCGTWPNAASYRFATVHDLPYDEAVLEAEPAVDDLLDGTALADAVRSLSFDLVPLVSRATVTVGRP